MKRCCVVLLPFFVWTFSLKAQEAEPRYHLHALADTAIHPEYQPYIDHWINFLYTEDQEKRKAYWSKTDHERWGNEYALILYGLTQFPTTQLLRYFKPYVLSVHCEAETCRVATAFSHPGFSPSDSTAKLNANPFCITEVMVVKQGERYVLTNLFDQRTAGYTRLKAGKINYLIEPGIEPDQEAIAAANHFTDSLANLFDTRTGAITYVVCSSPNELGYLLGYNFFYTGFTYGKTYHHARTLFSGLSSFNYPHELAHLIIDPTLTNTGRFFAEGLATYFGGSKEQTYPQLLPAFKEKFESVTVDNWTTITQHPNSPDAYTMAALLVEVVYAQQGMKGLRKLPGAPNDPEKALLHLTAQSGLKRKQLFKAINMRLEKTGN